MKMLRNFSSVSRNKNNFKFSFGIFLFILIILIFGGYMYYLKYNSGLLELYLLDVGQGDSLLLKTPDNKYLLVDTGPDNSVVSEIGEILPFWERNIDVLITSHPDADHIGGTPALMNKYRVDRHFSVNIDKKTEIYDEIKDLWEVNRNYLGDLRENDDFSLGCCVSLDVLWPSLNLKYDTVEDVNNLSTIINLKYKDLDILFTGDADKSIESIIVKNNPIDIDILKVSHHGSDTATSEDFIETFKPEIALIGVGADNKYGHPKEEVINRLKSNNIIIFDTPTSGTKKITSDGIHLWY